MYSIFQIFFFFILKCLCELELKYEKDHMNVNTYQIKSYSFVDLIDVMCTEPMQRF